MKKKNIKQKGGEGVITASIDLINSTISLGDSIFKEIYEITQIDKQLSNGIVKEPGVPNVMKGPPTFTAPSL
jgi:hypothetical protein